MGVRPPGDGVQPDGKPGMNLFRHVRYKLVFHTHETAANPVCNSGTSIWVRVPPPGWLSIHMR